MCIDSALSFEEAIMGSAAPKATIDTLALIDVDHISFDGRLHRGQLLVHRSITTETSEIFAELLSLSFPIQKVIPIVHYGWDDDASMADNNSSAFNYRNILDTDALSNHARGLAIDINPLLNPSEPSKGVVIPIGSTHDTGKPGTFATGSAAVDTFISRGWDWGGLWPEKDWQHFAKAPRRV